MKKLLIGLLFPFAVNAQEPPADMYHEQVPIGIHCVDSFQRMTEILLEYHGEFPIIMSEMSETTTIILFVNAEHTTSSFVVNKKYKDSDTACIIWGGKSPDGLSLIVNPNPRNSIMGM